MGLTPFTFKGSKGLTAICRRAIEQWALINLRVF
jgi:hypothetical protein